MSAPGPRPVEATHSDSEPARAVRFSVIVPLYTGGATLAATLDAILAQTRPPLEVIVVDDASTDDGAMVTEQYRNAIKLLRLNNNSGVQAARNRGIDHAAGDWIALCDQDDLWAPDYLARHAALIAAAPRLDFVFANFRRTVHGNMEPQAKFDQAPPGFWQQCGRRVLAEGWVFDRCIAGQTFVWHPMFPSATVISRRLIETVGGFDTAMRGLRPEDGEFTLRCLYRATVGAIPDPVVTIQRHGGNFSRDQMLSLVDEVAALRFVRSHHEAARPYWPIIDDQIRRRRISAAHAAFARGEHSLLRRLGGEIDPHDQTLALRVKLAVAALPAPLDNWINAALQHAGAACRVVARGARH